MFRCVRPGPRCNLRLHTTYGTMADLYVIVPQVGGDVRYASPTHQYSQNSSIGSKESLITSLLVC